MPDFGWSVRSTRGSLGLMSEVGEGGSCGTEPLTCEVRTQSRWLMSELKGVVGHAVGVQRVGELTGLRTTPPCLVSEVRERK